MPSKVPQVTTAPALARGSALNADDSGIPHHYTRTPRVTLADRDREQLVAVRQRDDVGAVARWHRLAVADALGVEIVEALLRQLRHRVCRRQELELPGGEGGHRAGFRDTESAALRPPKFG